MRLTVPFLESITSISPGPWWLNPLWSLRQRVEVSGMSSEAIAARHDPTSAGPPCWRRAVGCGAK